MIHMKKTSMIRYCRHVYPFTDPSLGNKFNHLGSNKVKGEKRYMSSIIYNGTCFFSHLYFYYYGKQTYFLKE